MLCLLQISCRLPCWCSLHRVLPVPLWYVMPNQEVLLIHASIPNDGFGWMAFDAEEYLATDRTAFENRGEWKPSATSCCQVVHETANSRLSILSKILQLDAYSDWHALNRSNTNVQPSAVQCTCNSVNMCYDENRSHIKLRKDVVSIGILSEI